ncbi:MAG: hypothetical protein ABIG95_03170 [Candidatus Woesearchaeota archaeon]
MEKPEHQATACGLLVRRSIEARGDRNLTGLEMQKKTPWPELMAVDPALLGYILLGRDLRVIAPTDPRIGTNQPNLVQEALEPGVKDGLGLCNRGATTS